MNKIEKPVDIFNEINTNYYPMIEYLLSLRDVKELTNEEMDSLISEDKLCILCYENPSNTELIPCKHRLYAQNKPAGPLPTIIGLLISS